DGALPRNLFFYFMDNPLVTRDQIFEVFWPKLTTKEATNVFHVTKRKISERITMKIDMPGNYELTQYSAGFYKPSEKLTRYYDVEEFEEAVNQSMTAIEEDDEEVLLRRAIELYKGPFLQDGPMPWMAARRDEIRSKYAQALIGMGRISQSRDEQMTALGYYVRALKETPEREDIHRDVMNIYIDQQMIDDARAQYKYLTDILDENLGIGPSPESRELFDQIK
ncbi:MAG: bacterial transcriptional activator domain-containing protein, partial [Chloroflexota bacterium]